MTCPRSDRGSAPRQSGSRAYTVNLCTPVPHVKALSSPMILPREGLLLTLRCTNGPASAGSTAAWMAFFSGCSSGVWVGTVTGGACFSEVESPSGNMPRRARALRPTWEANKRMVKSFIIRIIPCKCHKSLCYYMEIHGWVLHKLNQRVLSPTLHPPTPPHHGCPNLLSS